MNVDNENQHSSRAAHYQHPPLIPLKLYNICWAQGRACCVVSTGCWIRSGVANFTRFIHHFPNIGLQITPGWTVNTFLAPPPPLLTSSWPWHVVNVSQLSQDHNPCPITCLLSPLSSEPSIRMLTPPPAPPPHPSMTASWQVGWCSPDKAW